MTFFHLILAFAAGLALGSFHFWALRLTVQRLPDTTRPWLLALGSFWFRLLIALSGFYLASQGRWENLSVCLAGFFLRRWVLVRPYQPKAETE